MKWVQHMKTLEDLYLGKISPCENMFRGNDKYKDLLRLYSSNQEKLLSTLTEEQKERYEKYTTVQMSCAMNLKNNRS